MTFRKMTKWKHKLYKIKASEILRNVLELTLMENLEKNL